MNRKSGITLIELLIVIATIGILIGIIGSNYSGIRNRVVFENQIEGIAVDLQWTRSRSIAQEGGEQWGVRFDNPMGDSNDFYEIWYGDSYAAGTVVNRTNLHGSVAFSDPPQAFTKDIVFSKATGAPTASSTIKLYSFDGVSTGTIDVNIQGRIDTTLN